MGHSYSCLFGFWWVFLKILNVSWFTFPAGKKVVRNVGAEARGARRAGARLATAGSLQWVESNEVAGKFLPLWPPSPPSLFFFFFHFEKGQRFQKGKRVLAFPSLCPLSSLFSFSLPGVTPGFLCPSGNCKRAALKAPGQSPLCNLQLDRKAGED